MPFLSYSHHVSVRQEARAAMSSLSTCKDKSRSDAADRREVPQHLEGAAGRCEHSLGCFILCGVVRALCLLRKTPSPWKHRHRALED